MRTSTSKGAGVEAELPKKARVSQEWSWVFWWDGASVGASLKVLWGGEASDGALPCESRGQVKGVPGWWS